MWAHARTSESPSDALSAFACCCSTKPAANSAHSMASLPAVYDSLRLRFVAMWGRQGIPRRLHLLHVPSFEQSMSHLTFDRRQALHAVFTTRLSHTHSSPRRTQRPHGRSFVQAVLAR